MKGIVVLYDSSKGFGFIRSKEYDDDVFVHIKNVSNASSLTPGQAVEFNTQKTEKGNTAVSVVAGRQQLSPFVLYGIVSVVLIFIVTYFLDQKNYQLFAYIIATNIVTFIFYGYDKMIASSNIIRVPEFVLHSLAMIGGSPAAFLAQKLFRHKTIKSSFQKTYWIIVLVQVLVGAWILIKVYN